MRELFSIFLSVWLFLGGIMPKNDVEELAKIPTLIRHYAMHKADAKGNLGFVSFFREHYSGVMPAGDGHEDLPFVKHTLPCLVFIIPQFLVEFCPGVVQLASLSFPEPNPIFPNHEPNIWQPPQLS
jgi:hypothetical protein